jgi:FKBP-type peptidyl-prolyl cis-trans isomerase
VSLRSRLALCALLALSIVASGCGSDSSTGSQAQQRVAAQKARQEARRIAAHQRALAIHRARARAQRAAARQQVILAAKRAQQRRARAEQAAAAAQAAPSTSSSSSSCDPNYSGACLDPNASDYDCAGGSGDGPKYTGPVTVVGVDHYGLDADGDGQACESY